MFDAVIVEDDRMVAMLHRRFMDQDGRFRIAAEFASGKTALSWLLTHRADLIILDVYMPVMTGVELLRELRAHGLGVDVIMVTAANDAQTLAELLRLGVTDYLVKPFTLRRLRQALDTFCRNRESLAGTETVNQADIDRLLRAPEPVPVPKGLQEATLARVRGLLLDAADACTSEELSERAGLSVVTVRRYLNHLLETGEAERAVNYNTGGRPSMVYRARRSPETEAGNGRKTKND